jgi:hypothetical protein
MIAFLVLLFPVALLLFMLGMERVESPLRGVAADRDVDEFLGKARRSDQTS